MTTHELARHPSSSGSQPGGTDEDDITISHHTAAALVDRTARQVVDVLAGRRTVEQIRGWVSRPVAGLLAAVAHSRREAGHTYRLLSVHPCLTSPSTIEASAVIGAPRVARALSLRLQRRTGTGWSCTLLAFL